MVLFGKKALLDNINNQNISHVDLTNNHKDLFLLLNKHKISYSIKNQNYFNKFDNKLNHQGVITYLKTNNNINSIKDLISFTTTKDKSLVVILDGIQDPQNFGSIIRTCEAFGVDAIIYKSTNQVQINDFVIKTSMGAISNINLIKVNNINNAIQELKDTHYWIYASVLSNDSLDYGKVKFDKKTVLIVGNENDGISNLVIKNSDFKINIPMIGKVQSLNVAVATGILISRIKNS